VPFPIPSDPWHPAPPEEGEIRKPCLRDIKCVRCLSGECGYNAWSGVISICNWHISSITAMRQLFRHELSHADSACRTLMLNCRDCMREEKKAYWRAGQCTSNRECTYMTWEYSRRSKFSCFRRRPEEFMPFRAVSSSVPTESQSPGELHGNGRYWQASVADLVGRRNPQVRSLNLSGV
jgi:hypothetical protein